jgi:hypothetical protein
VGLGAVESYINAKLNALPASESMLSSEDKSAGMSFGRRQGSIPTDNARRETPRPSVDRGPKRDGNRREDTRRDSRPRDSYPRDAHSREDRSPDIRKSISEATGGALDMSADTHPVARPSSSARSDSSRRREPPRAAAKQEKRGPRPEQRREGGRAGNRERQPMPRANPQKPSSRQGNPYDMPIEERMKLYREKYGKGLGDGKPRRGQAKPALHGGGAPAPKPASAGRTSGKADVPGKALPEGRSEPTPKKSGFFGHLFGSGKGKKRD